MSYAILVGDDRLPWQTGGNDEQENLEYFTACLRSFNTCSGGSDAVIFIWPWFLTEFSWHNTKCVPVFRACKN